MENLHFVFRKVRKSTGSPKKTASNIHVQFGAPSYFMPKDWNLNLMERWSIGLHWMRTKNHNYKLNKVDVRCIHRRRRLKRHFTSVLETSYFIAKKSSKQYHFNIKLSRKLLENLAKKTQSNKYWYFETNSSSRMGWHIAKSRLFSVR